MLNNVQCAWQRLDRLDKRLFMQAWLGLGVAQLLLKLLSFRRLSRFMGEVMAESPAHIAEEEMAYAQRIRLAIERATRYRFWSVRCLPQAMTAKMMLQQRGIRSTLYLGAMFNEQRELEAHAWLRCGPSLVTGGAGHEQFRVVATFSEPDSLSSDAGLQKVIQRKL